MTVERTDAEQAALNEIQTISFARIAAAIANLERVSYQEHISIQEYPADADLTVKPIGTRSYTKLVGPGASDVDSTSIVFDSDNVSVIADIADEKLPITRPSLPFDLPPVFLSERQMDNFSYAKRDTIMGGADFVTYTIVEYGKSIGESPYTILVVEESSREVIQVISWSLTSAFLFRSEDKVVLEIAKSDSTWLPAQYRYELAIKTPFRKKRQFKVDKTYDYLAPVV
ncbi:MAG: hypothetical protein HKN13_09450 [Rhodothermales bacterium]|nr:hypothetical protein [Rhodothermales bacterium]